MIEVLKSGELMRHGDAVALIAHDGTLTYRALAAAVRMLAARMRAEGIGPGDRVAVQLPNSAATAVALLAAAEVGAVVVPVQSALRGAAAQALAADCEPRLAVTTPALASQWRVPAWTPTPEWLQASASDAVTRVVRDAADIAAIIYTSGSTGQSKGVMLSRANMESALAAVQDYLQLRLSDRIYSALPLSSSYGLYQLVTALSLGAQLILDRSFAFPQQSVRLLAQHRATVFAAVPTQVAWLLRSPDDSRGALGSLRIVTTAAAALPVEHARRLSALLPAARLFVMYGQTECKRISYLDPEDLTRKPGSVGRGLAIQRHVIVDAALRPVPPGEAGELCVQGPHVMQGYWRQPELTATALVELPGQQGLWLRTGDQFRADAEGYLFFQGRGDEILKVGGHKVSPVEIEDVLVRHPDVAEAAVVGQPDAEWGQAVKACIVAAVGRKPDVEALRLHCAQSLPRYMVPKSFVLMAELPKTESGKVRKQLLDLVGGAGIEPATPAV